MAARHEVSRRGRWLAAGGLVAGALALYWHGWVDGTDPSQQIGGSSRSRHSGSPVPIRRSDTCARAWWTCSRPSSAAPRTFARRILGLCSAPGLEPRVEPGKFRSPMPYGSLVRLGAGRLVEGEVVGTGKRLTVSARIVEVPGGATRARASAEGSVDSLTQLVDRLAASLLALGAGEEEQRLAGLTSTSLPALRAYLDGEALLRRGSFMEAERKVPGSVRLDSTFALASLGSSRAAEWYSDATDRALPAWHTATGCHAATSHGWRSRWVHDTPPGRAWGSRSRLRSDLSRSHRTARRRGTLWATICSISVRWPVSATIISVPGRPSTDRSASIRSYAPTLQHLSSIAAGLGDTAGVHARARADASQRLGVSQCRGETLACGRLPG